jgi:hypothetical protein
VDRYSLLREGLDHLLLLGLTFYLMPVLTGAFWTSPLLLHEIWHNEDTNRYTTVQNHPGDIPEGTLRAILREADIEPDDFLKKK